MRKTFRLLALLMVAMLVSPHARGAGQRSEPDMDKPIITIKSDAYNVSGAANQFGIMLGATETDFFNIDTGSGLQKMEVNPWKIEDGAIQGSYKSISVSNEGEIKIYGDPSKIDLIQLQGGYVTEIEMEQCKNLEVLDLSHNALKKLDLSPFTRLYAIYLSDNPFTKETPLKVGAPKNQLSILEIDIVDHLDQSFNLSDYPALQAFDAYHNLDLWNIDPTGCPELLTMSLELTNVSSLDISKNPKLLSLNISETRITSIDLSNNPQLSILMAEHASGFVNKGYRLETIDLSKLPNLNILYLGGNGLENLDLSDNHALTHISLGNNRLTSLDLSKNTNLYSVTVSRNNMDFATLPAPQQTWGEYFYLQNEIPVSKSLDTNSTLDLSSRVIRSGTETTASLWIRAIDGEDRPADKALYDYADGKITFNREIADSVYVKYQNSLFNEYPLSTTPFVVKKTSEMGLPSETLSITPGSSTNNNFFVRIGMYGASEDNPVTFLVDFGDGVKKEFTSTSALLPGQPNVSGIISPYVPVRFYAPEGTVMTAVGIEGMSISYIDLKKAPELRELRINNTDLASIDLRYNRCLENLNLDNNNLSNIDLTGLYANWDKNVLTDFSAAGNMLTEAIIVSTIQLEKLNLADNKFEEFSLKDYDRLKTLNLSGNLLSGDFSLAYQGAAENIDLSGNQISRVVYDSFENLRNLDISDNRLTLETLPFNPGAQNYIYAPQKPLELAKSAPAVNLSGQNRIINGEGTLFSWKKADGTPLVEGTDLTCENGIAKFLNSDLGEVYCELTNPAFPALKGDNALRTTLVRVVSVPTKAVATFTTTENSDHGELILASDINTALYVDWRGDGTEYIPYETYNDSPYNAYEGIQTYKDAKVTVYTYDNPEDIKVFSLYNIKMAQLDASPLSNLIALSIGGAGLAKDKFVLPQADLQELNLMGNEIDEFIWTGKYPSLRSLNLSSNNLSSFDASEFKDLQTLYLSSNKLTDVKFDNPNIWEVGLNNNLFENIDLTGLKRPEQLWLFGNNLSSIDVSTFKGSLSVLDVSSNRFTFATLPLPTDYPRLSMYRYGNQAPVEAIVSDDRMTFDLSSQAVVDDVYQTTYTWFAGEPTYDSASGELSGETLTENEQYTIENGVTNFTAKMSEEVVCIMTNNLFPAAFLQTPGYRVGLEEGSVDETATFDNGTVDVYTLSGLIVKRGVAKTEALENLPEGIYISDGKKVIVKR